MHYVFQSTFDKSKWLGLNLTLLVASLWNTSRATYLISKMEQKINDGMMNRRRKIRQKPKQNFCSFSVTTGWLEWSFNFSSSSCSKIWRLNIGKVKPFQSNFNPLQIKHFFRKYLHNGFRLLFTELHKDICEIYIKWTIKY